MACDNNYVRHSVTAHCSIYKHNIIKFYTLYCIINGTLNSNRQSVRVLISLNFFFLT